MTKKGYPGLVLVPPSDRTIVRRRFLRWSLFGLAILWGIVIFLSSLAPSNKSDCQSVDAQTSPSTVQDDCNLATASIPQSQPRTEEIPPVTGALPNPAPLEGQNSLVFPSPESTTRASERTTDHPSNAGSPTDQNQGADHTGTVQPELKSTSTQPPYQSTKPPTTTDHQVAAPTVSGPAPQHLTPSSHATSGGKVVAQPGNGSVPGQAFNHVQKPSSHTSDYKPATQPIPTQPAKITTSNTEHKLAGQPGSGTVANQSSTKPKVTTQPGNGAGQPQTPSQPAKSVTPSTDNKQTAQPHNGSAPHQTVPQAVNPKPPSPDRKVVAQLGNSSVNSTHPTGNTHSEAGQSGNGASHNQSLSPNAHEDIRLAEAGDAFAQYRLGRFYAQQGGSQIPEAVKWYKKASNGLRHLAEAGNGQAMYILGVMYAYGRGVKKDVEQARHWLSQAVSHKITAARPILASLEKNDNAGIHPR